LKILLEKSKNKFLALIFSVLVLLGLSTFSSRADESSTRVRENVAAGFLFDRFDLTLEIGRRTEAAGPFYYSERTEDDATLAFPPLVSFYKNSATNSGEFDLLYPLLSFENYGDEWRWQFGELLSFAGGRQPDEFQTRRFTLFPVYFQQRSLDTNLDYTAVFPFYGRLQYRLFRDKTFFVLFPCYSETQKKDVVTDNYLWPVGHLRHGNGLNGWQIWPFAGAEHKVVTTETNGFGDVATVGGHEHSFILWPFWISQDNNLGVAGPEKFRASIPLFAVTRSPDRDATSVIWPLFTVVDERGKKYHEWEGPWPFVIFARGEGKTTDRVWPLFSRSHNATLESDSYLWPLYSYKRTHDEPLDWQSTRILFYLFVGVTEKNTATGGVKLRRDAWPFFTWRKDFNGNTRLQVFAPIEAMLGESRGITRNWSPLWTVWHSEKSAHGMANESCLWNLYHYERNPEFKKISLVFGLYQYQNVDGQGRTRLFYIPLSGKR
jgi:hypothetical protein